MWSGQMLLMSASNQLVCPLNRFFFAPGLYLRVLFVHNVSLQTRNTCLMYTFILHCSCESKIKTVVSSVSESKWGALDFFLMTAYRISIFFFFPVFCVCNVEWHGEVWVLLMSLQLHSVAERMTPKFAVCVCVCMHKMGWIHSASLASSSVFMLFPLQGADNDVSAWLKVLQLVRAVTLPFVAFKSAHFVSWSNEKLTKKHWSLLYRTKWQREKKVNESFLLMLGNVSCVCSDYMAD